MRLLLFHPGAARIDCGDCAKWIYDLQTGEQETYQSGPDRDELPLARTPGTPTPCEKCPKGGPERARETELNQKNWRAWAHWLECRAVGMSEAERRDPIVRRNAGIIDRIIRDKERQQSAREFAEAFAAIFVRK